MHIRDRLAAHPGDDRLVAVAHRVVYGGSRYFAPVRVDAAVLADLRSYIPLAPLHQPFALEAIEALLALHPELPQIACFDTALHHRSEERRVGKECVSTCRSRWSQYH